MITAQTSLNNSLHEWLVKYAEERGLSLSSAIRFLLIKAKTVIEKGENNG